MARKIPKSLQSWIIPKLRRLSMYWPGKNIARDLAKVKVQIGKTKNGHPLYRVLFKCNICKGYFKRDETQMDHIEPVIEINGFKTWDEFMDRLFAKPEQYQCLCTSCHNKKTIKENIIREKVKKRLTKSKK